MKPAPLPPPSGQPQPTLKVDELCLRPWRESDAPGVERAYADPDIQRWHGRSMTSGEALSWVQSWGVRWVDESAAGWAVVDDGRLVGRITYRSIDLTDGSAEVGYWVVPEARGRRIASRALTVASAWMLDVIGLHRIWLVHSVQNVASCRVAERAGFVAEGTMRDQARHADGWHDMHLHARLARDLIAP